MLDDIIIYGAGGMAKEVVELIENINMRTPRWNIKGYIDDSKGSCNEIINGYKILGKREILKDIPEFTNVVIAIGNPEERKKIFVSLQGYPLKYPVLIHPTARIARSVKIGEGTIIGIDCIVSPDVIIGKHVFLNMRTVLGHDVTVDDFSSCLVNSIICGSVKVKEGVLIGSNSIIMEKKVIGKNAKVSMGSVVSFDVEEGYVVMSRPSKCMKFE